MLIPGWMNRLELLNIRQLTTRTGFRCFAAAGVRRIPYVIFGKLLEAAPRLPARRPRTLLRTDKYHRDRRAGGVRI